MIYNVCVDFIDRSVKRVSKWMQDVGLGWFYCFWQEPKRMFKRYFIDDMRIF
ncbi:MAG: WecB/TagA/CpsF family glycosyltransferase [Firmicutes bacterium]|nr:WecB/TagA/CpsF family glycosyltransferase [Bacillota bacterium]